MAEATRTDQPTYVDRKLTAQQFLDYFLNDIAAEANFTEENNEDRTLGDYLADLSARCERILRGELTVTDPLDATIPPIHQWVTGRDMAEAVRGLCACPENDDPEYVRGAWEATLSALGVLDDEAREENGAVGGACTHMVLISPREVIPEKGPIQRSEDTALAVIEALGLEQEIEPMGRVARIIREQEVEA